MADVPLPEIAAAAGARINKPWLPAILIWPPLPKLTLRLTPLLTILGVVLSGVAKVNVPTLVPLPPPTRFKSLAPLPTNVRLEIVELPEMLRLAAPTKPLPMLAMTALAFGTTAPVQLAVFCQFWNNPVVASPLVALVAVMADRKSVV